MASVRRTVLLAVALAPVACSSGSSSTTPATDAAGDATSGDTGAPIDASADASTDVVGEVANDDGGSTVDVALPETPPPSPHPCTQLPAAGTWEAINPPGGGTYMGGLAADPVHPGTVYVGASIDPSPPTGIWKTDDCGATWAKISTGKNGTVFDHGWPQAIVIDPTKPTTIYATTFHGDQGLWKSTDGGVDWDAITPTAAGVPTFIQDVSMDPTNPQHLAITFHEDCMAPWNKFCVGETKDGGATWRIVNGPTELTGWVEFGGVDVVAGDTWLLPAPFTGLFYTRDAGATWEKVVGYPGCYYPSFVKGSDGAYYMGCFNGTSTATQGGVLRSVDAHAWTVLAGSPQAVALIEGEGTWYASFQSDTSGKPFYSAPSSDPTKWTNVTTPTMTEGSFNMAYDATHHVLYSSGFNAGLWRYVAK